MSSTYPNESPAIRLWPGIVIVALVTVAMFVPRLVIPQTMVHFISMFAGPPLGLLFAIIWWVFLAGVRGPMRWLVPALLVLPAIGLAMTLFKLTAPAIVIFAVPFVLAVWVGWLTMTQMVAPSLQNVGMLFVIALAWGVVSLVRFDGLEGDFLPNLSWRWAPSEEERFLAGRANPATQQPAEKAAIVSAPGDWPEFRGPARDSRVAGVAIDSDWVAHPPKLVWKQRIGPGWSSFAIVGDHIFTQEQRSDQECVACYSAATGKELWEYRHPGRFEEAVSGVGPRSTPTFSDGRIYTMGAMGYVACLDAATGREIWTADVVKSMNGTIPQWGYSSSPLIVNGVCIAYVGGGEGKGLAGFDAKKGTHLWSAGDAVHSYSSPHRATLDGVEQVLLSSEVGVESFDPATGTLLWQHDWNIPGMNRVTQPAIVSGTDLLIGTGVGPEQGTRRLHISKKDTTWSAKPEWTTRAMKAYFNDGVIHAGHFYGFDTSRFVCVQLDNGKLVWKDGGRNGNGQVLLLADQGLLLILAADGTLALSEATPQGPKELARIPALEGKTWNHPVYHGGRLYLRNPQEMACYELKMR